MISSIRRNKNNSIEKIEEDIRKELYKYKNGEIDCYSKFIVIETVYD